MNVRIMPVNFSSAKLLIFTCIVKIDELKIQVLELGQDCHSCYCVTCLFFYFPPPSKSDSVLLCG